MQLNKILSKYTIFFSITIIICLTCSFIKCFSNDTGDPYIERIILDNYGFNNDNFSIIQDKSGIIYIANTNGILQYHGSWDILKIPGIPFFDINEKGVIYVGAKHNFGYIASDNTGKSKYISLSDSLKTTINGHIKQVISYKNEVYFSTGKLIFKWKDKNLSKLDSFQTEIELFKVNNQLFLEEKNVGLKKLTNNQFVEFNKSEYILEDNILDILAYNQDFLIKTENKKGFFLLNSDTLKPFPTQADDYLHKNIYSHSCLLSDSNYAIGTKLSGIIIINKEGKLISAIDENSGLFNLSVNKLYADKHNNLWALHNQGISRIEFPSPYSYFSRKHGLKGNVNSVIKYNQKLYVATSLGVFYLNQDNTNNCFNCSTFKDVENIKSICYNFHLFKNRLFVSCSNGLYEILDNKALLFYNRKANEITSVHHSKKNPQYIILGFSDGLSAIKYSGGMLIVEKKIQGINSKITSITEDVKGNIWFSDNEKVYKINSFEKFSKNLEFNTFDDKNNLPANPEWINLYSIHNSILISTSKGIFQLNEKNNLFFKDTLMGIDSDSWIYPVIEDNKKNIWFNIISKNNTRNKTMVKNFSNQYYTATRPLPLNRIKDFFITSIHPDENNVVWFGAFEGLIRYNLDYNIENKKDFSVLIHKVTIGKDSIIYQLPFGKELKKNISNHEISYNLNTISFDFSSTHYSSESQLLYKYKLEGFDNTWSNWTNLNYKEYTNLFEGDYRFRIKAKNIFEEISPEVTYDFSVKPPFYRTFLAIVIYAISSLLFFIFINKWRAYYFARERFRLENIINERTEEVVIQKEKADNLLERVLPKTTATELKQGKKAGPYHYNMVTVLFSDIQGFTKITEQLESELLIDELDKFFLQFDSVVEKYNIEKIKTIGDAYMCAGGIPAKNRTNPVEVVLAAMEMQHYMRELKRTSKETPVHIWDLRIGIDTGPVVAGVLGRSKISYDIWGGTVNTASRMEASGEPGKINITENTYMLIKDFFLCQYRGKMPVKYKGEIDMYFVEGFKPHLASDPEGYKPNETFFTQLQILRINDLEEFVLTKLENGLPGNLYYHNVKHTIDVVTQVELIGRSENVSDEDMLLLKTAALFHDMGHLVNYDTHEEESVKLAKNILPKYSYKEEQIKTICDLIMVTKMPPEPKNLLEEIMCDADLDYLGRTDFVPISISLYKEYYERNKIDSILNWNHMQQEFIKKHHYFTKTAQNLREVNKKKQLENIESEIRKDLEKQDE